MIDALAVPHLRVRGLLLPDLRRELVAPAETARLAAVHPGGELRLLRLVGPALRPAARRRRRSSTSSPAVAIHRHQRRDAAPRCCSASRWSANLGVLGYFKYYGFFVTSVANALARVGHRRSTRRCSRSSLPGRDLVLHVPGAQLHDRHLPRRAPSRRRCSTSRVYLSFFPHLVAGPIVRAREFAAAARRARRPAPRSTSRAAFWLIFVGLFKKVVIVELPRHRDRRPGVRATRTRTPRSEILVGDLRATRSRSTPTSAATPTSPSAARCCSASASRRTSTRRTRAHVAPGLLAALAHHAVALAARLPLHPARRQPRRRAARRTAT